MSRYYTHKYIGFNCLSIRRHYLGWIEWQFDLHIPKGQVGTLIGRFRCLINPKLQGFDKICQNPGIFCPFLLANLFRPSFPC